MSSPFLAKVPRKYLEDINEREFWNYLIRWLDENVSNTGISVSDDISDLFTQREGESESQSGEIQYYSEADIFRAKSQDGGTITAIDKDFINATNNATINLETNPPENAVIKVRNGDGSNIRVLSDKLINGANSVTITRRDTVLDFNYILDRDTWSIV